MENTNEIIKRINDKINNNLELSDDDLIDLLMIKLLMEEK
jgi:hypothetical protein